MTPEELRDLRKEFNLLKQNISDLFERIEKEKRDRRIRFCIGFVVGFIVGSVIIKLML